MSTDMRLVAKAYLDAGYEIVPLVPGQKLTHDKGWQKRTYTLDDVRSDSNLGLKNVRQTTIDLDCLFAVACADEFMLDTPRIDGRPGKLRSHRAFANDDLPSEDFKDIDQDFDKQTMLVQILHGRAQQVVVPPSLWVDPDNPAHQERRAWIDGSVTGPPAVKVDKTLLRTRVVYIATVSLIARHWPPRGIRRELRLAYARVLLDTLKIDVEVAVRILSWACRLGGSDEEGISHAARAVYDTKQALDHHENTTGAPTVAKLLPDDNEGEKLVAQLRKWYGIGPSSDVIICKASDVQDERLVTVFGGRLILGAFPLVVGPGDVGKGMLLVYTIACFTTGRPFPGETTTRQPMNVLMCATEDSKARIKSRLRAAGADLERVFFIEGPKEMRGGLTMASQMRLDDDAGSLVHHAKQLDSRLLVLETTVEHLGDREGKSPRRSTNNDADMRSALAPFREICQQSRMFGLGAIHPRKSKEGGIDDSISGSAAFQNVPRGVLYVHRDPTDEASNPRRLLISTKANYLSSRPSTLRFHIQSWDEERGTPCFCGRVNCGHEGRLVWDEDVEDDRTAEQVWKQIGERGKPRRDVAIQQAEEFLLALMKGDCINLTAEDILKLAKDEGIADKSVYAAKRNLKLVSERDGFQGPVVRWRVGKLWKPGIDI